MAGKYKDHIEIKNVAEEFDEVFDNGEDISEFIDYSKGRRPNLEQKRDNFNPMQIIPVTETNLYVYHNLAQCYEAEFSPLTGKKPDASGLFALDTPIGGDVLGYLLYIDDTPAGLAAISQKEDSRFEVCEFYIVPLFRKNATGMRFAHAIWRRHSGRWEIKQIEGADYATAFWRKTIARYNDTPFSEDRYDDPYWGNVTRQRFVIV